MLHNPGQLQVNIDGPTKTDIKRQDQGDKADIQYLPMTPGVYNISIKYAGKEITGSPFIAKVSGTLLYSIYLLL